jgi:bacterioferritin-associated ferredoxin
VCRCEDVTLVELEHAIDAGHRDIESLKRFTGFGTGWCQGKQCLVACARVLEDRAGQFPLAPVTPRPPVHPMPLGMLASLIDAVSLDRATSAREANDLGESVTIHHDPEERER